MSGRKLIAIGAVLLFLAHQDFFFWDSEQLVLGFMPIGLAYHAAYTLAAAALWAAAIKLAWPQELIDLANDEPSPRPEASE